MMKTFRPFFSAPELEPDELPPDELEELHAAARMDSRTSAASSGSALFLADVLPLAEPLIDESFQLMGPKSWMPIVRIGVPPEAVRGG
jgi:hypothetical protein